VGQHL